MAGMARQLDLPIIGGEPIPVLYTQVDGTGVPVVKKETVGRQGKTEGQPAHTREAKWGCVFTQTTWDNEGYAIRDPGSTTYVGAIETAEEFGNASIWKQGSAVGPAPKRRFSWAMDRNGFGTLPTNIFPARFRSSIAFTPGNTCGIRRASCTPTKRPNRDVG